MELKKVCQFIERMDPDGCIMEMFNEGYSDDEIRETCIDILTQWYEEDGDVRYLKALEMLGFNGKCKHL